MNRCSLDVVDLERDHAAAPHQHAGLVREADAWVVVNVRPPPELGDALDFADEATEDIFHGNRSKAARR